MSCPTFRWDHCCSCCCCCPRSRRNKYPHIKFKSSEEASREVVMPDMNHIPFQKIFQLPQPQSEPFPYQHEVVTQQPILHRRQPSEELITSMRRRTLSEISISTSDLSDSLGAVDDQTEPLEIYDEEPTLQFSLYYDIQRHALTVHLQQAYDLPAMDKSPSVTLYLEPKKVEIFECKVVAHNRNPVLDQVFEFKHLQADEVRRQSLVFRVYCHDRLSKNDFVGAVVLPLREADLLGVTVEMVIDKDADIYSTGGDLLLSLMYQPAQQRIHGVVLKATIKKQTTFGSADHYVKVYSLHQGKKQSKWKTSIRKNTRVPLFNESFCLNIAKLDKKDISLEFVVMVYDRLTSDDKVGFIRIGEQSEHESGRIHWAEMLSLPHHAVCQWHSIMPLSP